MSIFRKTMQLAAITLIGSSAAATAIAVEGETPSSAGGWVYQELEESLAAKKARGGRTYVPSELLYADRTDTNSAAFICAGKKLSLIVSMEPQDMSEILNSEGSSRRALKRTMSLYINGENVDRAPWMIKSGSNIAAPVNQRTVKKVYNASIRGDKVELLRKSSEPKTEIALPKINNDFAGFGAPCGIGNNK